MKNLLPLNNSFSYFERIADSKSNPTKRRLNNLKQQLRNYYNNYQDNAESNSLEQLVSAIFNRRDHEALLSCYNSSTYALDEMKSEIRLNQSFPADTFCQYCMVRRPDSFDHYIPKNNFCEYAVHSLNLLPICDPCNRRKGDHWLDLGVRNFLNLYFDNIVSYRVLYCKIIYEGDIPIVRFSLKRNRYLSQAQNELIRQHYYRLDLINLFQDEANSVVVETIRSIKNFRPRMTKNRIKNFLLRDVKSLRVIFGINYWEALIKQELSKKNEFYRTILH